jgi:YVTN family beta-propeller protein
MKKLFLLFLCIGLIMMPLSAVAATFTFTNDADWDSGLYVSTNSGPPGADDQIQIDPNILTPFNHIWVALSGRDGVARIDTDVDPTTIGNGDTYLTSTEAGGAAVLGEYLSRPDGMQGNPSRVTTDLNGDVWVGNRNEAGGGKGSVTKISAKPTGTTSSGAWNGSTFDRLGWSNSGGVDSNGGTTTASDTAILNYVRTTATNVRAVAVDANNNVWVGGGNDNYHELINGNTGAPVGGVGNSFDVSPYGGYGALVDGNGVVWSSDWPTGSTSKLVRHDPATNTTTLINNDRDTYGLGIDTNGYIWVANYSYNTVQKVSPSGTIVGTYSTGGASGDRGVAVTPIDNNVWVANSGGNTVSRLDNNGNYLGQVTVGSMPTGVAVDSNGKVWVTNYNSDTVQRIDPTTNTVDLTIYLGSNANPYNYSDMTGTVVSGTTNPTGTWRYVADGGIIGQEWDQIFWNTEAEGEIPLGTNITIEARVADTLAALSFAPYFAFGSGDFLNLTGRHLEVRATLTRTGGGINAVSPILSDLSFSTGDITKPVPEPATMGLLGLGAAMLGFVRRRKKV